MSFKRRLYLAGIIALVMIVVIFGNLGSGRVAQVLQNTAHIPAFGCIALLVFLGLRRARQPQRSWRNYVIAFAVAVLLGILVEIVQSLLQRDAEVQDVIHDALGALVTLSFAGAVESRRSTRWMITWLCCGMTGLVIGAWPAAWASAAWLKQEQQFPTLSRFDSVIDRFYFRSDADIRVVALPQALARVVNEQALLLPLVGGDYPGVEIIDPHADWRGRSELLLDIANPTAMPLTLHIRVNDRHHTFENDDRWSGTILLPPLARITNRFSLTDIESAPRTRRMDMSAIASVIIFTDPQPGSAVLLKSLALQ